MLEITTDSLTFVPLKRTGIIYSGFQDKSAEYLLAPYRHLRWSHGFLTMLHGLQQERTNFLVTITLEVDKCRCRNRSHSTAVHCYKYVIKLHFCHAHLDHFHRCHSLLFPPPSNFLWIHAQKSISTVNVLSTSTFNCLCICEFQSLTFIKFC